MRFNYRKSTNLPQLAWCAIVTKENETVDVKCGNTVQIQDDFFVAGVWDGEFEKGDFAHSHFVCCTGATVNKSESGGVKFTTPSHLLEAIYAIRIDDTYYISNSIPFVLAQSKSALLKDYLDYERDLCSSLFGVERQICTTPLDANRSLEIYRACSFEITPDLQITKQNFQSNLNFSNYAEYISSIRNVLRRIKQNAESPLRSKPYGMITTISRGYDATATSALVHEIGCDKALTFCQPASYAEDDGAGIAKQLGYTEVYEENANLYKSNSTLLEASTAAADCNGGFSLVFAAYGEMFADNLLFLGERGDSLWAKGHANVNNKQDFTNGNTFSQADHSCVELSLDMNYIFIFVPMIGADRWESIDKISSSEEMKGYSVGNNYDRPIPRRILEEKGIARSEFGWEKRGAGISYHFDTFSHLISKMSPKSAEDLIAFRKTFKSSKWKQFRHNLKFYAAEYPTYVNYILSKTPIKLRLNKTGKFISSPHSTLLFNWSISRLIPRYKD